MKITVKNFQKRIPVNPQKIKKTILKILSLESSKKKGEINVCFVSDFKITKLNRDYLKKNCPTDVLAFDLSKPGMKSPLFADILISVDTARRNARRYGTTLSKELELYVVHGLLHLLGYNDHNSKERMLIRKKEKEYVNR